MPEVTATFPRAWVEFADPETFNPEEDEYPDTVYRCDLTWLTSAYKCIFGQGCQGIYEDAPNNGCCTLGAHFTDEDDIKRTTGWVNQLTPDTWQQYSAEWTQTNDDGTQQTKVAKGGCVFLNDPDFPAGGGCALHHLAERNGVSHVETKPDVCWQLPIERTYRNATRRDDSEYLEITISEFDRTGWGEGGQELDWYCTQNTEAHVGLEPLYISSEAELRELMGHRAYEQLVVHCEELLSAPKPVFTHLATTEAIDENRLAPRPVFVGAPTRR